MTTYSYQVIGREWPVGVAWWAGTFMLGDAFGLVGGVQFYLAPNERLYRSMTLTMTPTVAAGVNTGIVTISMCSNPNDFTVFDDLNLPSNQPTIQLYSGAHTFAVGVQSTFTLGLDVDPLQAGSFVGSFQTPMQVIGNSSFSGNFALVVTYDSALAVTLDVATVALTTDETPYLSGLPTTKHRLSRADFCPRCGEAIFREQLRPDGYTKTLVCSKCWDPAERRYPRRPPLKEVNP